MSLKLELELDSLTNEPRGTEPLAAHEQLDSFAALDLLPLFLYPNYALMLSS